MECPRVLRLLHEYIDDSLDWREAEEIDQHLCVCAGCAGELQELKSLQQVMRSMSRKEPPLDLDLQVKILASRQSASLFPGRAFERMKDFARPLAIPAW